MPVIFIGHGSPMNMVQDNSYTRDLARLAGSIPRPEAILVISAHWLTRGSFVTGNDRPETIHDFYGFPKELYEVKYPSPGAPELAETIARTVPKGSVKTSLEWGFDHASYAVLRHMYPSADIPVLEMSLDYMFDDPRPRPLEYHYKLARELAFLREKKVLILGSGNIVHNLGMIDFEDVEAEPFKWAAEFDKWVKKNLVKGDHESLFDPGKAGEAGELSVPSLDHYLPMIYAIGLKKKDEALTFTHEGIQNGSISMRCFRIG